MTDGVLTKIEIQPGINRNTTSYGAEGFWVDCDKVRFRSGKPEKMGGWQQRDVVGSIFGVPRNLITVFDLEAKFYAGLGTHQGFFVLDQDTWVNNTPVTTTTSTINITPQINTNLATVSITSHNATTSSLVKIASNLSLGGTTLVSGTYEITNVSTNNFDLKTGVTFTTNSVATTSTGIDFCLAAGFKDNQALFGYGAGTYGRSGYGTPVSADQELGIEGKLRTWSLGKWGEDLVVSPNYGAVYYYDRDSTSVTETYLISAAPNQNIFTKVSEPVRHVVAYGTKAVDGVFDPLLIRWSDQENFNDWTDTDSNAAGSFRLQRGSQLVGQMQGKREALVFTDEAAYAETYEEDFFFVYELAGNNCGLISQHATVEVNGIIYWMGLNGFFRYDGIVTQLRTSLDDELFDRTKEKSVNFSQKEKTYAGINSEFNEIWWLYPSRDSVECNRYVCYNYVEEVWYDGTINRTVWEDADVLELPVAMSPQGVMYNHEQGKNAENSIISSYIQSGDFDIEDGDELLLVDKFVPDFNQKGPLEVSFNFAKYPKGPKTTKGPFIINPNTQKLSFRGRGRQMNVKIASSVYNGDFELGTMRLNIKGGGEQ